MARRGVRLRREVKHKLDARVAADVGETARCFGGSSVAIIPFSMLGVGGFDRLSSYIKILERSRRVI